MKQIIDTILSVIPGLQLVYLFGSRASGNSHRGSDWDIAIMGECKLDSDKRWQLKASLEKVLNADVDLVDMLDASTVLRMQIVEHGKLLFDADDYAKMFETNTVSMYGNLQDARREIIENFLRRVESRGTTHA